MLSSTAVAKSIIDVLSETSDPDVDGASCSAPTGPADAAAGDSPAPARVPHADECPSSAHPKLADMHLSDTCPTSSRFSSDESDDQGREGDGWGAETTIHCQRVADQVQDRAKCPHSLDTAAADSGESLGNDESARPRGYLPIENYGMIGNMRTAALVATDASIDFMCFPKFDSPSVFCRLLDHEKGGYYQIHPTQATSHRQQYLPNSNVLVTRFLAENSASQVTDFFHVPDTANRETEPSSHIPTPRPGANWYATPLVSATSKPLLPWLIRVVESVRGCVEFEIVVQPAFGYALAGHVAHVLPAERVAAASRDNASLDASHNLTVVFNSHDDLNLDLRYVAYEVCSEAGCRVPLPKIQWEMVEDAQYNGPGVKAKFTLNEGQQVWFVLRERPPQPSIVVSEPHEAAVPSPPASQRLSPLMAGVGNVASRAPKAHVSEPSSTAAMLGRRFPMDPHGVLSSSEPGTPELRPVRPQATHHSSSSLQPPPTDFFLAGQAVSTFITRGGDATPKPPIPTDSPNGSVATSSPPSSSSAESPPPPPPLGSALNSTPRQTSSMTFPSVCGLPSAQKIPGTPNTSSITTSAGSEMDPPLTVALVQSLLRSTLRYWNQWIGQCTYTGRWRETVQRSALTLKLLTYQPTGAVIAAPTFSLPEEVGGGRTWDYRWVWLRDSSFVIYAFIRLGLISEARSFMRFIELVARDRNSDGSLNVMYTIEASRNIPELELTHLHGYRGSKPVRIGNAASTHLQLDIYGALLDTVYLMNKYSSPVGYDMWCVCQSLVNYVVAAHALPDMSIWEVRGKPMHFVYSKVMCWVAIDRGLRLAEKRVFPCPDRAKWMETRDAIYLEVMEKGWDKDRQCFKQAYESDALDAAVLIMPLVFFISPTDPRMLSTIAAILKPPELGGLTSNGLVYRYLSLDTDDGVGTGEGSFTMCGLWLCENLARAGMYIDKYKPRALYAFEQMLSYANHLDLYSEEVSGAGELVGNFPQAFTHIALISCAFNLDRILGKKPGQLL